MKICFLKTVFSSCVCRVYKYGNPFDILSKNRYTSRGEMGLGLLYLVIYKSEKSSLTGFFVFLYKKR